MFAPLSLIFIDALSLLARETNFTVQPTGDLFPSLGQVNFCFIDESSKDERTIQIRKCGGAQQSYIFIAAPSILVYDPSCVTCRALYKHHETKSTYQHGQNPLTVRLNFKTSLAMDCSFVLR